MGKSRLSLSDAIKHYEEVAEENEKEFRLCPYPTEDCNGTQDCRCLENGSGKGCLKCADEHRQLAEWLKELKERMEKDASDTNVGDIALSEQAKPKFNKQTNKQSEFVKSARQTNTDTIYRLEAIKAVDAIRHIATITMSDGDKCIRKSTAKYVLSILPSAQPETKPIGYRDCANAMLKIWMDNVVTDGEYNRIMDKLNAHWAERQ